MNQATESIHKVYDFLCAIDTETKIIIYRWYNWPGKPILNSTDINIQFLLFNGLSETFISENNFKNFEVIARPRLNRLILRQNQLSPEIAARLKFNNFKCKHIAQWLNSIQYKLSSAEGIFPGVYGVKPNSYEETLHRDNYQKIKDLASEIIYEYHDRLWLSQDENEFLDVYKSAKAKWRL